MENNYILEIRTLSNSKDVYYDPDTVLLHAAFQCLIDFVEKEDGLNHSNYDFHKKEIDKCKELYDWWLANHTNYDFNDTVEVDTKLKELIEIYHFLWT